LPKYRISKFDDNSRDMALPTKSLNMRNKDEVN